LATVFVATTGNDTTGDGSSGNPYASPGKAAGVATTAGDLIWVKSGTYTLTSSTPNVAGGKVELTAGVKMEGYETTVGDLGTPPIISAGSISSITICKVNGTFGTSLNGYINITVDGNSQASVVGFSDTASFAKVMRWLKAINCTTGFSITGTSYNNLYKCLAFGCTTGFNLVTTTLYGCAAIGGTTGFTSGNGVTITYNSCIAKGQSGRGFDCTYAVAHLGCVAYGCGSDGFRISNLEISSYTNCVAVLCTTNGWNLFSVATVLENCAGNGNGTNISLTPTKNINFQSLSGNPYDTAAIAALSSSSTWADVFAAFLPNATSGAGALLRAGTYPAYRDIGATQHADPTSGPVGQCCM
jgi:hypothetical protein